MRRDMSGTMPMKHRRYMNSMEESGGSLEDHWGEGLEGQEG